MPTRDTAPIGAPCWADLWTSDVEGSRSFYPALFGWEAQEPNAEFGGYFLFTRDGIPVAGAMGPFSDQAPSNRWSVYLCTDDVAKAVEVAEAEGAQVISPAMAVADLGSQAIFVDPSGAHFGAWQPEAFQGFTVLNEHGSPSWFELHTREHDRAVDFYTSVFRWDTHPMEGVPEMTYTLVREQGGEEDLAGVMDAAGFLPEDEPSQWAIYWEVDDVDGCVAKTIELGGKVIDEPADTPYGRIAWLADPTGATFKLRGPASQTD
jgi:predicted enzyme related to lactoylglutathione lyase